METLIQPTGHIYIIHGPRNLYIKIGRTSTCSAKLINHYVTAYGPEMTVYMFASDNTIVHERALHLQMRNNHLCGETFDLESLDSALAEAAIITGSQQEIIVYKSTRAKFCELKEDEINEPQVVEIIYQMNEYPIELPPNIANLYNEPRTLDIYHNLRLILQCDSPEKSLQIMSQNINNRSFVPDYVYTQHYVANELLQSIGFTSIIDNKIITRAEIKQKYNDPIARDRIIATNKYISRKTFNDKMQINADKKSWDPINLLRFVNGIFQKLYGFTIKSTKQIHNCKDNYKICHQYLGEIFPIEMSENTPYIIVGWNICDNLL